MLHQRFGADLLATVLLSRADWRPYPVLQDREAWEELPGEVRAGLREGGERSLAAEWPALPATLFLEFARNGNRSRFQERYFTRRNALCDLALAECAEGQGRFLDGIADVVWSLCEESCWALPAHIFRPQVGLGDTAAPYVDLFAAETAALLAWTNYLLGPALDDVSPLIRPRVAREIDYRLLTPCLERDDFWWMGLRGARAVNNWNPWINSNWLACALLIEEDSDRRRAAVAKSMRSLDVFIDDYPQDGGCDEGPSYWTRAGASLFDCLELLHSATAGAIDVFAEPQVKEIGRFIYRAHVANRWFINFADAPARLAPDGPLVFRYGRAIGDAEMMNFGAYLADMTGTRRRGVDSLPRRLPAYFTLDAMRETSPAAPLPRDVWLPDTQVMVARARAESAAGLFLAAKGGHNAESHNHNDVGHFIVYADGKPVLIDVGVETYSRKTFSPERYDIWTMQSQYHNLPTVNGVMQRNGRDFAARDLHYAADEAGAEFALDIAGAYPPDAGILAWRRIFTFAREGRIAVEDRYRLAAPPRELTFTLLTPCAVSIDPLGSIILSEREWGEGLTSGRALIRFPADKLRADVEEIAITDPQLQGAWGDRLFRILLRCMTPAREGEIMLRIEA